MKNNTSLGVWIGLATLLATAAVFGLWFSAAAAAPAEAVAAADPDVQKWGLVAAAAAAGLSSIAAGYAVASVGTAGVGALAENQELMGRVLILVGLAEGIAIYGLIVAVLIINVIT